MPGEGPRGANVLAIDLPGVEDALLEGMTQARLEAFRWIALAGVDPTLYEGATALGAAIERAARLNFRRGWSSQSVDPLWPAALLEVDERAIAADRRDEECAALSRQVAELRTQLDALAAARDEQAGRSAERQAQLEESARKAAAAFEEELAALRVQALALQQARGEQARLASERQDRLDAATRAMEQAEKLAEERRLQADALTRDKGLIAKARDEQARLLTERDRRVAQLEGELADLAGRQALLREELVKAEAQVELISDLIWREGKS